MYTSLSHHEQSILHRRNSAPVYHDARLGATREIVGGQRRWLCTCTPGTHKYRASDNQRVISLSSWRRDDARHLISSGINDRDQFVHEYESSKVDRYESVWADPCEFTIRCFESVYQMKENFYFYFIFTTGNGYTRWCNLSARRYSWFSVP